ncbi:MAG: myxococcus cysteine-rich repeat containing protein, partial [Candidatus Promineifilaceae bacterium]
SLATGWGQSQVNLTGIAISGDTIQLRFDMGLDGCNGTDGWYVDDFEVYSCSDEVICGNGLLDPGESCDDGNTANGDGCSNVCEVEDGWTCEDPVPPSPSANAIDDGSFEAGTPNPYWAESSTNFGTPICDVGSCGTGGGTGPSDGAYWTWFGGIAAYEEGSVSQSVSVPATATDLTFDLEQIACDSPADYMEMTVDGNQEFLTDGASALCGTLGYSTQTVDMSAYADDGSHTVEYHSEIFAKNGGSTNFFLDNVVLSDNQQSDGSPSVCTEIIEDLACDAGIVGFDAGIPSTWTVVDNAGQGLVWTNIAGSGEGGNYTSGDGDAATASSDVFGLADFDTELRSNVFSLANASSAMLDYLANYQNLAARDFLDLDITADGGGAWSNLLSWNEDHGGYYGTPGEAVSIDLSAYLGMSDLQLRWRYYDPTTFDWDWYAQVDEIELSCNLVVPDCSAAIPSMYTLWPPNYKFAPIDVLGVTDPDGDPVTITIDSIFQDELVGRVGRHSPDGRGVGKPTAEVRAERDGKGNGRVYHIYFTADFGRGGTCSSEVLVGVPHDQGIKGDPVDDGPLHDSTIPSWTRGIGSDRGSTVRADVQFLSTRPHNRW